MPKRQEAPKNSVFYQNLLFCLDKTGVQYIPSRKGGFGPWCKEHQLPTSTMHKCLREPGFVPRWDYLVKLSSIFDVSVDWLLTGKDHPKQKTEGQTTNVFSAKTLEYFTGIERFVPFVNEAVEREDYEEAVRKMGYGVTHARWIHENRKERAAVKAPKKGFQGR